MSISRLSFFAGALFLICHYIICFGENVKHIPMNNDRPTLRKRLRIDVAVLDQYLVDSTKELKSTNHNLLSGQAKFVGNFHKKKL